jgi:siroheme synthase-like protein
MDKETLRFLPVSINITDKKILLVGGGKVAFHKAGILSRFTDNAVVISPEFQEGFTGLPFTLIRKRYEPADLTGAFLVYVCTGDPSLNEQIKADCEKQGILASVCDNPALCDFVSPAIYRKGNMTVAVSSNAQNVRQSIDVRNQIQALAENGNISFDERTKSSYSSPKSSDANSDTEGPLTPNPLKGALVTRRKSPLGDLGAGDLEAEDSEAGYSGAENNSLIVPQGQHFINRRWSEAQPTDNKRLSVYPSPAGTAYIDNALIVSSLRDFVAYSSLSLRKLKHTVNKVLSHAGLQETRIIN